MSIPKIQNEIISKSVNFLKQPEIRRIFRVSRYLLVVFGFTIIITLTIFSSGRPFSNRLFAITSGSMRPKIPMGSLVIVKSIDDYKVGDVITFRDGQRLVSHRILVKLPEDQFQTKGDANTAPDRLSVSQDQIFGRVAIVVPRLGRLLMLLKTKIGVILLVVLPGAILIWQEIYLLIKTLNDSSNRTNLTNWSNWTNFFKHVPKTSNKQ